MSWIGKKAADVVTSGQQLINGTITAAKFAAGAVVAHLGYTPVNKAGDSMSGNLTVINASNPQLGVSDNNSYSRGYLRWLGSQGGVVLRNSDNSPLSLGTTDVDRLIIDSVGRIAMPYQPVFLVTNNTGMSIGTTYTKVSAFNQTVTNIGGCWNSGTQRFVAPIAGTYLFTATLLPPANMTNQIALYKNGATVNNAVWGYGSGSTRMTITVTVAVTLAANDYVEVYCQSSSAASWDNSGYFSGYLIG